VGLVGWFVTVLGWFVNNFFSDSRETRKETRAKIDRLNDELEKLLKSSHAYYCSSKKAEQKNAELEITASFNKLDGIVERLEEDNPELKIKNTLGDLFDAITGGEYGSDRVNRSPDVYTEKNERLALLSENIRSSCEIWFKNTFH